jgi:Concanavalin A-like lectin/glucanases superfamily/Calcineurin-like phosphoesterase
MLRCASIRSGLLPILALALGAALAAQSPRVHTSRPAGSQLLKLPKEDDAFGFVVFGDRTGGPVEGIEVLKQAVTDTNLLDPDLVLTVGDLINGYNADAAWQAQAAEYKAAMAQLRMPWFPVAGNHDIYWRGEGKPPGEHEANFEATFGPLWYAVQHKQCWFVVLYSDEGNPDTGEKNFNKPDCQRISEAQFTWLGETLQKAKGSRHVFVFLHHPRWLAKYGTDWDRVHGLLAQAGNVTAVFAGHIHRMRYDGVRDGIQYYTVASVGAHLDMEAPEAGYLHQFHVVTVRPEGITVAALPVGTVIDAQQITGTISEDCERVHGALQPELIRFDAAGAGAPVGVDASVDAIVTLRCRNPASRAIELELIPQADASWAFAPDHQHVIVAAGQSAETTFALRRAATPGQPFVLPQLQVRCDYLAAHRRIGLPARTFDLELPPPAGLGRSRAASEGVLSLDGKTGCLQLQSDHLLLPDGPFTVELWLRGTELTGRRGIVAKTEQSEWALFGSDGELDFSVFLGDRYARAASGKPVLEAGRWHHIAGVFDGNELRAYVDGQLVASQAGSGVRKANALPLFIGADPNGSGKPTSFFAGAIDEVRISTGARYTAPFSPPMRHEADADTVLLLPCDEPFGPWLPDHSGRQRHARAVGDAQCTVESRPGLR